MARDSERLSDLVSRRKFIATTGVLGAGALAGCTQDTDGGDGSDGDDGSSGGGSDGSDGSGGDGSDGSDGSDGDDGSSGDGSDGSDELSGEIIVKGSSTVFPVSDRMAQDFMEEHSEVNVTVDSTGSGGGFENWFCEGDADINGASRPIKDEEVEHCQSNDVEPVEFEIAGDALTVVVNNDAEWVDSITFDELSQIWREDGAETWSDVREEWPDREFQLFGPADTSGTYDWFNENVVGPDHNHTSSHEPTEEDELIVQGVRDNVGGMGYFGYAYYNANPDQVKALEVSASADEEPSPPSLDNAKDGSYPMARPLFIYPAESAVQREEVYEFLEYYLMRAETDVISEIGYVPSSEELRDENLARLEDLA